MTVSIYLFNDIPFNVNIYAPGACGIDNPSNIPIIGHLADKFYDVENYSTVIFKSQISNNRIFDCKYRVLEIAYDKSFNDVDISGLDTGATGEAHYDEIKRVSVHALPVVAKWTEKHGDGLQRRTLSNIYRSMCEYIQDFNDDDNIQEARDYIAVLRERWNL